MMCTVHRRHLHAQSIQKVWKDTRRAFYHHSSKATEQPTRSHHTKKLQSITPLATTTTAPYYKLTCLKTITSRNKPRYSFPLFLFPFSSLSLQTSPPSPILNAKKNIQKKAQIYKASNAPANSTPAPNIPVAIAFAAPAEEELPVVLAAVTWEGTEATEVGVGTPEVKGTPEAEVAFGKAVLLLEPAVALEPGLRTLKL